jgi:hypothetical protein
MSGRDDGSRASARGCSAWPHQNAVVMGSSQEGRPSGECGEHRALAAAVKRVMERLFLVWLAGNLNCIPVAVCASPKSHFKRVSGQARQRCQQMLVTAAVWSMGEGQQREPSLSHAGVLVCSTTSTMAWHVTTLDLLPPPETLLLRVSLCAPLLPGLHQSQEVAFPLFVCTAALGTSNLTRPPGCLVRRGTRLSGHVPARSRDTLPVPEMKQLQPRGSVLLAQYTFHGLEPALLGGTGRL